MLSWQLGDLQTALPSSLNAIFRLLQPDLSEPSLAVLEAIVAFVAAELLTAI